MTDSRIARTLLLACALIFAWLPAAATASQLGGSADPANRAQALNLRSGASALDRAAAAGKIPDASLLSSVSPALKPWLGAGLTAARKQKSARSRAADLRAMAVSLRNGADIALREPVAAPKDIAADARAVLAEPAFRTAVTSVPAVKKQQTWLERIWQSFIEWWGKVLGRAFTAASRAPVFGNIAAFVLIAAAAIALAFLIFRVTMLLLARRALANASAVDGTPLEARAGTAETYDAACAAARAGSYGSAIALLFQAALFALDKSGSVPYDSARTAGEYRRAVRRTVAGMSGPFDILVRAFTDVAYAQSPAGEADWRAAAAAYDSISLTAAVRR